MSLLLESGYVRLLLGRLKDPIEEGKEGINRIVSDKYYVEMKQASLL